MASTDAPGGPRKRAADTEASGPSLQGEPGGAAKKRARVGGGPASVAVELQGRNYQPTLGDVQNLLLRLFTTEYGENPKWMLIRGMNLIRTACVVLVPCLDASTLQAHKAHAPALARLRRLAGSQGFLTMRSAAEVEHLPKDLGAPLVGCRLLQVLLSARAKPSVTGRKSVLRLLTESGACKNEVESRTPGQQLPVAEASKGGGGRKPKPRIAAYLASELELKRSGYPPLEKASCSGWVTLVGGANDKQAAVECEETGDANAEVDPDRELLVGLDCEMVQTASGQALARCALVGVDGQVLYDSFVRPGEAITDYVTKYSGITAELLEGVTVTLQDVQKKLGELLNRRTILVGHSLESDLHALQLVHTRVLDTALLYPHTRGWPHRHGLAGLSSSVLKRKLDRDKGHDPVADAKAAMELALLKVERGPDFGAPGGVPTPLGQLLRGAGVRLTLEDPDRPAPAAATGSDIWHLAGFEAPSAAAPTEQPEGRQVRIVVLREFESDCRFATPATASSVGTSKASSLSTGAVAALSTVDKKVRHLAEGLESDELLVLLTGSGDLHSLRRLEEASKSHAGQLKAARARFKDAFGVFTLGGPALRALLEGEVRAAAPPPPPRPPLKRELVCYVDLDEL